jgi:hypothetical protein
MAMQHAGVGGENLVFLNETGVYCRNELFWKKRVEEVCDQVRELLGDTCSRCDLNQAGPECGGLGCAPLPLQVANDLFTEVSIPLVTEKDDGEGGDLTCLDGAHTVVTLDNSISPVHSLLQVTRKNRKGLLYDCLRTLKDMKLQVGFHLLAFQYLSVLVHSLMVHSVSSYLFLQSRLCKSLGYGPILLKQDSSSYYPPSCVFWSVWDTPSQ